MKNKSSQDVRDNKETAIVRRDMVFVTVLNMSLIALLVALFFWNESTGAVDGFFAKFINY